MPPETFVVLLTAPGRSAIATLLVAGPYATEISARLFTPFGKASLAERPVGRIVAGHWPSGDAAEEIVACRVADDRVELHCHGGHAASRAIVATLVEAGCKEISWQQWLQRSATDPLSAAAEIALAKAPTERTALLLLEQRGGALRRALDAIRDRITQGEFDAALALTKELADWSIVGMHLTRPWLVVLAGRPNVGKSSLINALVGYQRAIVHELPGTTRDVVTAVTALDGWPIELADTAGLRAGEEPLEREGIELARRHTAAADLVLLVCDRSGPWTAEDEQLAAQFPHALRVINKCDLPPAAGAPTGTVEVSALAGSGIDQLAKAIVERLVPRSPPAGQALVFLEPQFESLRALQQAVAARDTRGAQAALASFERC